MKKSVLWFLKAAVAAVIAFGMMSCFCFFYYNLPVHYTEASGSSDYSWDQNAFCSRGTEGFAWQFTDENGYINTYPEKSERIDILVMGTSHSEGFNVNYDENYTYVLNQLLDQGGHDLYAYSIATSGHALERNVRNLENAVKRFQPQLYVVIELKDLDREALPFYNMLNGNLSVLESVDSELLNRLQRSDFLRLLYYQLSQVSENQSRQTAQADPYDALLEEYLDQTLAKASQITGAAGCQLIITNLAPVEFDYNGVLSEAVDPEKKAMYQRLCQKHGIVFLDMYPAYEEMYGSTYHLPRGFSNTAPGEGHLNKYGHACVAQELYKCITKEDIE